MSLNHIRMKKFLEKKSVSVLWILIVCCRRIRNCWWNYSLEKQAFYRLFHILFIYSMPKWVKPFGQYWKTSSPSLNTLSRESYFSHETCSLYFYFIFLLLTLKIHKLWFVWLVPTRLILAKNLFNNPHPSLASCDN